MVNIKKREREYLQMRGRKKWGDSKSFGQKVNE